MGRSYWNPSDVTQLHLFMMLGWGGGYLLIVPFCDEGVEVVDIY